MHYWVEVRMKDYLLSRLLRAVMFTGKSIGLAPSHVRRGAMNWLDEVIVEFVARAKLFISLCICQ